MFHGYSKETAAGGGHIKQLLVILVVLNWASGQQTKVAKGTTSDPTEVRLLCNRGNDRVQGNITYFLNGSDVTTNLSQYMEGNGEIKFTMRQDLEGEYTCYPGENCTPWQCSPTPVTARPNCNESIPQYYLQRAGKSVTMICGIRQGLLEQHYVASWKFNNVRNVEHKNSFKNRVSVVRKQLQDFSMILSELSVSDSANYFCLVKIFQDPNKLDGNPIHTIQNDGITLQVFHLPVIDFLSSNQTHSTNGTQSLPISFTCNAIGGPNLQITWNHNDIPIPPDSLDFTSTMQKIGNDRVISELNVTRPTLGNSGEITCEASISYHEALDGGIKGEVVTKSEKKNRLLVILDSSLSPIFYPTTDKDLLVRMDIPDGTKLPKDTKILLKTTPTDSIEEVPIFITIDNVIFEGLRVYGFVPASRLEYQRFVGQVALVFNLVQGPFNPPDDGITSAHVVDFGDMKECDNINIPVIVLSALVGIILVLVSILISTVLVYKHRHKRLKVYTCCDMFDHLKQRLEYEHNRDPPRVKKIDELDGMVNSIIEIRRCIIGGSHSDESNTRRTRQGSTCGDYEQEQETQIGNRNVAVYSNGGMIAADGKSKEHEREKCRERIMQLLDQIKTARSCDQGRKTP